MSTLYIVATPIGNLSDITQRALETLKRVSFILCEDTRRTQKLLNHFEIKAKLISYHQHSKLGKVDKILGLLDSGNDLALVSDAGTPGISDPGGQLVEAVIKKFGDKVKIEPIPGPSAITAAASIAGISMDKFLFLGFPPAKNKRNKFFQQVANSPYPVVLFESPHRILKTLDDLTDVSKYKNINMSIIVCRELTKKFETTYRGTPQEVIEQLKNSVTKGEFVIIINPC